MFFSFLSWKLNLCFIRTIFSVVVCFLPFTFNKTEIKKMIKHHLNYFFSSPPLFPPKKIAFPRYTRLRLISPTMQNLSWNLRGTLTIRICISYRFGEWICERLLHWCRRSPSVQSRKHKYHIQKLRWIFWRVVKHKESSTRLRKIPFLEMTHSQSKM